jgi:hypothetical protein
MTAVMEIVDVGLRDVDAVLLRVSNVGALPDSTRPLILAPKLRGDRGFG